MNRVRSEPTGYTIVETMIFLAVSGILFFSAMLLVNGQQRKTEFETNVRDFNTKLQSVIGNVASGYYNNPGAIICDADPGPPRRPRITDIPDDATSQGLNEDCTFVGQFITVPNPPGNDRFTITSHAGLRLNDSGEEVQSLAESIPTPITQTAEDYELLNGLRAKMRIATKDAGGVIVGGIPIVTLAVAPTFGSYNAFGDLNSGSARVDFHAIKSDGIDTVNPGDGIQICIVDDPNTDNIGPGQTGLIYLSNGNTSVTIDNDNGVCPW